MQNDVNHEDDELFGAESADDTTTTNHEGSMSDGSTTEEAGFDPDNEGEETTTDGTQSTPSEAAKSTQVDAWVRKIESGESTLEELSTKQKWLTPLVKDRLEARNQVKAQILTEEAQKLIKQELEKERAELRDRDEYQQQLNHIRSLNLSASQKKVIVEKFKELKDTLGKSKALSIASQIARVEDSAMESRQKAASMQYGGGVSESSRPNDVNALTSEQRYEELQKRRARRGF